MFRIPLLKAMAMPRAISDSGMARTTISVMPIMSLSGSVRMTI